ncbi:uncharacterized protein LOC119729837 [Patiria miniata]|uniref:Aminopeptidase N n=1 Tax=Patiria miniata TaxID=46514 RepID=A0A914A3Y7_PATMI|nr:uncharacterized protein LOC119729837 [Patiria miniata]
MAEWWTRLRCFLRGTPSWQPPLEYSGSSEGIPLISHEDHGSVKKVTVTMGMDGTLEIDKESGKPVRKGMYCSHAQMLFVFITACIIITGVGLLAYYVPDRCADITEATPAPAVGQSRADAPRGEEESPSLSEETNGGEVQVVRQKAEDWKGRLPLDVIPKRYNVLLQPFITTDDAQDSLMGRNFTFDGLVTIKVECNKPTKTITLHTLELTLHEPPKVTSLRDGVDAKDLFESYEFDKEYDFLVITLKESLMRGQDYEIKVNYSGELNDKLAGWYRSSYITADGEERWIATSQMQPTDARRALPCFDEPAFKAVFDVEITHRPTMTALANGIERPGEIKLPVGTDGRWVVTRFKRVREMSTYLLAFVVCDFKYTNATTENGILFRVWSRPDAVENTKYALDVGTKILTYFEDYFDFAYPLEKQDMVAVPDFSAGAMENWGLILYRETALLYDPELNSASNKQRVAVVVSHELAHQWFGNLVTPEWWDDLWLNEGFATYVEYLGVAEVEPTWQMKLQFLVEDLQPVFTEDALGTSHPVKVPVGAPSEINEIFDSISYQKGGSIIRMLDNILTEEVFKMGLNYYLFERFYGNANSDDLWTVLTYADKGIGDNDVKKIMDTWTLQMGYPYVTFQRNGAMLTATQRHFLNNPNSTVEDGNFGNQGYLWYVYLLYTHETEQEYTNPMTQWMNKERTVEFSLGSTYEEDDWYLVNVKQYGYYRVNYDTENWQRLSDQLEAKHEVIPIENRAALIDDAFNLARAGVIEQTTALSLTKYLTKEKQYLPWESTLVVISYIRDMFSRYSGYGPLEKYMLKQIKPLYDDLGWNDNITAPDNSHLTQYNRINALGTACRYGLKDCVMEASRLYKVYMDNPSVNPITPNLKSVVYCNGIRYGGQDEWEFGWGRYGNTSDSSEKTKWLSALACSTEPWILSRFLEYSTTKIPQGDTINVIRYIAYNYVGRALAWDFVRANWDKLYNEYNLDQRFPDILRALAQHCNTDYDITEIRSFYKKQKKVSSVKKAVDMSIDRTQANIRWMNENAESVRIWFMNAMKQDRQFRTQECVNEISASSIRALLKDTNMGRSEFNLEEEPGRKGNGIYCSPAVLVFTVLTVCVLIAATALMTYYIPLSLKDDGVATKAPAVQLPSTTKAMMAPTDAPMVPTDAPMVPTDAPMVPTDAPTNKPMATAKPTTMPPSALMRGRLPKTVLPRRYEVNLRPFLYDDDVPDSKMGERFTFDGWVRIKVECIEPTDEITLHSKNITVHGMPTVLSVSTLDKTDLFESYKMVEEYAFMILKLKQMMKPHQEYDIYMQHSGILGDDEAGFYPSMYLDSVNTTRYIATTQMEGPFARRVFPCFDEPTFKASYDVQLEHRNDMQALSNGIETKHIRLDGHWSRTYFERVPSVPTYLLAFIVHDYSSINVTNANGCLIRIWCQTDLIQLAPYALNVSDLVQTYFDDYLDNEYPLAKQDHIAIQDFGAGAMENWGLITYQDIYLLYGMEDFGDNTFYSLIITHELAHMWFGNLVTMEWWDDLWLNEGFATYMEHIGVDHVHPEFNTFQTFYVDTINIALFYDSLGIYPAIRAPVYADDDDIDNQFTTITYQKGGSLLYMMEHFLTIEVFNRGVKNYLKERAYKNANAEQLWHELTYADKDVGKHDVKKIMDTWTLQRGYPLITLTRTGNSIVATQKIFLQINRTIEDDGFGDLGYKWYVPLTYVYKSGPGDQYEKPQQVWMKPSDDYTYFDLPDDAKADDWYLANANTIGLYRVNYEDDNWQRLLDQAAMDPDVFSEENKVGLIYDSYYLAQAGVVPMSYYDSFSEPFRNNSRRARRAAISTSSYFARMLDTKTKTNIKRRSVSSVQTYMQSLVEPLYMESGWDESFVPDLPAASGRREQSSRFDITSTACRYGNRHCITKATDMFKEYMNDPTHNTIPDNFRTTVYCNGIRFGGESEWDFAFNMLRTSHDRRERARWVSALTCSVDTSLLQSYLQLMMDSTTFSRRDVELILMGVAENPDGYAVAWDFLRDNWDAISTMFKRKRQSLCDIFEGITSFFNTEEQLQELLDFGHGRNLRALKYAYKSAIASTQVNIRWMENRAADAEALVRSAI